MKLLTFTRWLLASAVAAPVHVIRGQSKNETAPSAPFSNVRVRLNPASTRDLGDNDFVTWTVPNAASASFKGNGSISYALAAASGKLNGNYNKVVYRRMIGSLGERVIAEGISTVTDAGDKAAGVAITLTISGLATGEHSLLTWHNAWDKINGTALLNVAVGGEEVAKNVKQSVRTDNIWESASSYVTFIATEGKTVEIVYTPDNRGEGRAYLNGFEIDGPALKNQIGFPSPAHRDERIERAGNRAGVAASWRAAGTGGVTYNVYLGTSPANLERVATGSTKTSAMFSGVNTMDTYYWRVDVMSGNETYIGRVWTFRLAQLAFPGAEGYGRFARGGRGGKVIHVTSLADSEEEGTLRYALTKATGPRIIVFDVSGIITTKSRMSVNAQYVTLAGQTAPGKGIVIQGYPLGLTGASDIIFRHIRVRPGTVSGQTIDGMGMQGSNHAIFDRCSMGWTIDESFSSRDAHNITLQRSMISEPLNIAGHKNYPNGTMHGYAASIGGAVGSFHHNLIAHAEGRSWSMAGGVDDAANFAGLLDIRNNVVYNFGGRVTDGGCHQGQFVSNLYKRGPASNLTYAFRAQYEDGLPGTQQYYCAGNAMPGVFTQDSEQYVGDGTGKTKNIACYADVTIDGVNYQKFVEKPFFESYVKTQTATEAYKIVLSDSGVSQPVQDDHDKRILRETFGGTATYKGSKGGKLGIIDSPSDVGGLEEFTEARRDASWDADGDGIADWWDGSTGGDGYTPIEGYLNFMAEPHAFVAPDSSVEIDLAALAAGFAKPSFAVSGVEIGAVEVSGSKAMYTASKAGVERLTVSIQDSEGSTWSRPFGLAVFEAADEVQSVLLTYCAAICNSVYFHPISSSWQYIHVIVPNHAAFNFGPNPTRGSQDRVVRTCLPICAAFVPAMRNLDAVMQIRQQSVRSYPEPLAPFCDQQRILQSNPGSLSIKLLKIKHSQFTPPQTFTIDPFLSIHPFNAYATLAFLALAPPYLLTLSIIYAFKRRRPVSTWSLKQAIGNEFMRLALAFQTHIRIKPTYANISKPKERYVLVQPGPSSLYTDVLQRDVIKPTSIPAV
ncbi:polysaccharide lyase family 1 protein [Lentithecium fluviatile CBS 122367]|uniref:Polysaccharide lyase family 1 protein n=1 Tax=Lentithecium fluviatile CBS 122367 TaxID=1168545 RepID=A0A6G1IS77_9PLEO|nr:polysaccharide lyase family 1 protein [Lentithecium fluviatile CBS 122367]